MLSEDLADLDSTVTITKVFSKNQSDVLFKMAHHI